MNELKIWLKRFSKVIASAFAFFINTVGLVLSIVGTIPDERTNTENIITALLIVSECLLIFAAIYTVITILQNYHTRDTIADVKIQIDFCKKANCSIVENFKTSITYYKDTIDKLNSLSTEYKTRYDALNALKKRIVSSESSTPDYSKELKDYIDESEKTDILTMQNELVDLYNRVNVNLINILHDSIKKYLMTKGCSREVAIAIKQLDQPTRYSELNERKSNIYTAFRDSKTYKMKKRNETWEKTFSIIKNSDFVFSIEKDFYIFNFIKRKEFENGLYLNENSGYHEHYNSGVTCSIHSCSNKERVLYGFLACDSLFDENDQKNCGGDIFDYNVANMMMATAHIIALFMERFLEVWNEYYVENAYSIGWHSENAKNKEAYGLCQTMVERIRKSRSPF